MDAFMREYAALDPEFESVMTVKSRAEALEAAGLREQAMSQENVEIVRRCLFRSRRPRSPRRSRG
jgi:hypothetical protein